MCGSAAPNDERLHRQQAEFIARQQAQLNALNAEQQRRHQAALNSHRTQADIDRYQREQEERRGVPDARKGKDGTWEF